MIPGFNHNIKYKDQVFHLQTEDSGIANPHVITHLFVGGNIIDSRKMSYADIVKSDKLEEVIVELMQEQHKQMMRDLVSGMFDDKIQQRSLGAAHLNGPAPLNVSKGQGKSSVMLPSFDGAAQEKRPATAKPAAQQPVATPPFRPQPPVAPAAAAKPPAPPPVVSSPAETMRPSFFQPSLSLASSSTPASSPVSPDETPEDARIINADSLQKAFATNNKAAINSIFGEDLISEKSLDEVILGYLAEDVQGS